MKIQQDFKTKLASEQQTATTKLETAKRELGATHAKDTAELTAKFTQEKVCSIWLF